MYAAIKEGDGMAIRKYYQDGHSKIRHTPFMHVAAVVGNVKSIEILYELDPASINISDETGVLTPIHIAAYKDHVDAIEVIHKLSKSSVDVRNEAGISETPLVCAVQNGSTRAVEKLVQLGADIKQKSKNGDDLLMIAVKANEPETVTTLCKLKRRWPVAYRKSEGPFHIAAQRGHYDVITALYNAGYKDIDSLSTWETTPLFDATAREKMKCIVTLHALGSNAHFKPGVLGISPATYVSILTAFVGPVPRDYSTAIAKRVRTLYYSRSLLEVMFYTETEHKTPKKRTT
jgi:hypothetical protein